MGREWGGEGPQSLKNPSSRNKRSRVERGSIKLPEQPDSGTAPNVNCLCTKRCKYKGGRKKGLLLFAFLEARNHPAALIVKSLHSAMRSGTVHNIQERVEQISGFWKNKSPWLRLC